MASNKTVLTSAQKAKRSSLFGSEAAERPHTLTREVDDLRSDVEAAFARLETLNTIPVIYSNNIIPQTTGKKVCSSAGTIQGTNLLCGQTQASVTIANITFTAILPGTAANAFSVEIVQGNAGLSSALNANKLTITLAGANNTNTEIESEVNADHTLKITAKVNANGGDNCAVAAASALSGGVGAGVELIVNNLAESKEISADIKTFSNTVITIKEGVTAFTDATVTGGIASVQVKNLNNNALSTPYPTLVIIA